MRVRGAVLWLLVCLPANAVAQAPADAAGATPPVRLGGYLQFDYLAPPAGTLQDNDSFRVRRARLQLAGRLGEKVEWAVSAEGTRIPVLRDAYITFRHVPAATIRVGQLVMPYALEQYVFSSNTLEFTERILTDLVPARDLGLMVSNDRPLFGWFSYAAAVINGTGQNTPDDNRAKDAVLRLTAAPSRIPGLAVSANVARGDQPRGMRTRRGIDVSFERRSYHLAAELVREHTVGSPHLSGMYVFGAWRFYPKQPRSGFHHLEFGSRFGRNTGRTEYRSQWDLAANYYVHQHLRFMWDFILYSDAPRGADRTSFQARANVRF